MNAMELVALLAFVGMVVSWAFLPSGVSRAVDKEEERSAVNMTPIHEN